MISRDIYSLKMMRDPVRKILVRTGVQESGALNRNARRISKFYFRLVNVMVYTKNNTAFLKIVFIFAIRSLY